MSKTYLFLDDIRDPSWVHWMRLPKLDDCDWVIVRNFEEFKTHIVQHGLPDFISFDHDLELEEPQDVPSEMAIFPGIEPTGMECAKWLVEWCMDKKAPCPDFAVHSQNPAGKENIQGLLTRFARFQIEEAVAVPETNKPQPPSSRL